MKLFLLLLLFLLSVTLESLSVHHIEGRIPEIHLRRGDEEDAQVYPLQKCF